MIKQNKLHIALLAPFEEPVPPHKYGGTELVVYNLAEELVKLGHQVTLFASGDSVTSATLYACVPQAIRTLPEARNYTLRQSLNYLGLSQAISAISKGTFDVIHNHFGWQTLLFKDLVPCPIVTTLHGTLADPAEKFMHDQFKSQAFVSISDSQRKHDPDLQYVSTVYNGIQVERFPFNGKPRDYIAFLGRIHPQKGPEYAIEIAKKTGIPLIIAAKVDPVDEGYFEQTVKPHINGEHVKFIGEVDHEAKIDLLKNARALISPIQWDEPFGVTNIESLACGTPVITIGRGSLPEIIINKKTGYLCKDIKEMTRRVHDIAAIDRKACRQHVERHFTAKHMALGYLSAYRTVIKRREHAT